MFIFHPILFILLISTFSLSLSILIKSFLTFCFPFLTNIYIFAKIVHGFPFSQDFRIFGFLWKTKLKFLFKEFMKKTNTSMVEFFIHFFFLTNCLHWHATLLLLPQFYLHLTHHMDTFPFDLQYIHASFPFISM